MCRSERPVDRFDGEHRTEPISQPIADVLIDPDVRLTRPCFPIDEYDFVLLTRGLPWYGRWAHSFLVASILTLLMISVEYWISRLQTTDDQAPPEFPWPKLLYPATALVLGLGVLLWGKFLGSNRVADRTRAQLVTDLEDRFKSGGREVSSRRRDQEERS